MRLAVALSWLALAGLAVGNAFLLKSEKLAVFAGPCVALAILAVASRGRWGAAFFGAGGILVALFGTLGLLLGLLCPHGCSSIDGTYFFNTLAMIFLGSISAVVGVGTLRQMGEL
jgi:hypothetical protein